MKYKVGDKVIRTSDKKEATVIFIDPLDKEQPYLIAYLSETGIRHFVSWQSEESLIMAPKIKLGDIWVTRNGYEVQIVSVCEDRAVGIIHANTPFVDALRYTIDGIYRKDSEYDLIERLIN